MTRKDLYKTVRVLRESGAFNESESEAFKKVIATANEEDFQQLEEMIMEAAEQTTAVGQDLIRLAELIYPEFAGQDEAKKFAQDNSNLEELEFVGYDVFQIKAPELNDRGRRVGKKEVYHIIARFKYENIEYGFGYNKNTNAISFSIDGDTPDYNNLKNKVKDYEKIITVITYFMEYAVGI